MTQLSRRVFFIHLLLITTICGLALGVRLWQIDQLPPGFHFDEAFEGLEAWRILTEPSYRPIFLTGNFGVPPLNAYANALTFGIWQAWGRPVGPTAMRVTAALLGTLTVLGLYALAGELRRQGREWGAPSAAFPLLAAAILAGMRWHIHFSRMGIEPIFVPLVWTLATGLLLYGWRTGNRPAFVGSGVVLAAGMYAYQGAWVIPFLLLATALLLLIHQWRHPLPNTPTRGQRWRGLLVTGVVAALLFAPLAWFFAQNMELIFLRPAQLSIVGETSSGADSTVWASLWATAKMYGPFGAPGDQDPRRNLPGAPALSLWFALPFYLGLLRALRYCYQPRYAIILVGLVGLLVPGVVSEYAPHFHRILGATAPTALLCALGLDWLWQWRPRGYPVTFIAIGPWLVAFLLTTGTLREVENYFVRWAALPDLFYAFDVGLWEIGQSIAVQPAEMPIYLTPRTADHATLAFAWATRADAHAAPVTFDGRQIFPHTAGDNPTAETYAVIEHEDFRARLLLPELFPSATITHEIVDSNGAIYARLYERPAHTPAMRQPQTLIQPNGQVLPLLDGIGLLGYDVQPAPLTAGAILYLQLYWQVSAPPVTDWTVFTHLLRVNDDGSTTQVAGRDSRPGGGSLPTVRWQAGWRILDELQLVLPPDLPPGAYRLEIGLYPSPGIDLPTAVAGYGPLALGTVQIE